MATFELALKPRLIYVFAINDKSHSDCLKIGETTLEEGSIGEQPNSNALNKSARQRIDQYTTTAGIAYQLLYTELTLYIDHNTIKSFNDKQVHLILGRSGIKKKTFDKVKGANEWYCCDLETVKRAISAAKEGRTSLLSSEISVGQNPIIFRDEQLKAISMTRKRFQKGNQMLWNAKMRFGKTLTALQVAKEEKFQRTLIVTHRPVVDEGWFEDFNKIFYDSPQWHYGSHNKGEDFMSLERLASRGDKYVYFASMQDMRGSELVGGKFDKNVEVFQTKWDFLIIDEAHEGTTTVLGKNVIEALSKPETKVLRLSGTPFNLIDDFEEDEIFTWDYVMEQKAKADWDLTHFGDPNPYEQLPAINIYTYDLGSLMPNFSDDEKAFNFREFFRTKDDGGFVYDSDVDNFLNLLCKDDKDSLYPYANDDFRKIFRHTLWVVPGVKAARELSTKLRNHPGFGVFEVVNVAGSGDEDEENADALKMVNEKIGPDPDQTYTITLSCGRLTTGVSVKPWTAVFMLSGSYSTSAAQYMQTIFRVQTPFTIHGRMKTQCYAFDFAPDRTLRVLVETAKVSAKVGKATEEDRKKLGEFINFCPIISIEGSQMKPYDVNKMMGQLKKAQIEKVVQCGFEDLNLYNDELMKLSDLDLKDFADLKDKIGKTKAMAKSGEIDVNKQGLTNEQYEELERLKKKPKKEKTEEELAREAELKKLSGQRREAASILRGISIRMPLLIYGAELKNEDEEITIDNFAELIDDTSWEEFMPRGVTKEVFVRFKKYYEADVFREAGKRIREMARVADKFTIEERIERIAAIFNTFRNPDKETVLTPWRVVNMHMSDCLGGWCFYDEQFKETLQVPRYVRQGKVTSDVFRPDSHILEINSKSGLYPLYVAYNIYRSRVDAAKAKYGEVNHGFAMSLWDATIEENILVVCKTPMAKSITKRTLAGFRNTRVNAQYYPDLIQNITNNPTVVVNTLKDGKRFWKINNNENMKFDAIVGNPPYQVMDGGTDRGAVPVYHNFVGLASKVKPNYISMIMPARWYAGGRGLDDFRAAMLSDKHIRILFDYETSKDLFPTVDIAGGLCYYLWNKNEEGLCNVSNVNSVDRNRTERYLDEFPVFVRSNASIPILKKVVGQSKGFLNSLVLSINPFGFRTYYRGREEKRAGDIRILTSEGWGYVSKADVSKGKEYIAKYKIIVGRFVPSNGELNVKPGEGYRVLTTPRILNADEINTETYIDTAVFNTLAEALNYKNYLCTKFARYMLRQAITSVNVTRECFAFVPLQDFTKPWTDEELYKKYKLSEDEIAFIESMIKPMD